MKKIVLAAVLAGLSGIAAAEGLYVQGDVGYTKLQAKADGKISDGNVGARVALGREAGSVRYGVDYTYFGRIKDSENSPYGTYSYEGKLDAHSVGLSAVYDFKNQSRLTPYVGARVGVNVLHLDFKERGDGRSDSYTFRKTKVGVGALAGVQYRINDKFAVNTGIEYNYLGKVDDVKFSQYGANVGLRYNF
ncbi:opacity family porin [Neisseria chenwenguii]|nr:opacity family porin [Neisseria chenwenguii]